jgi:pyruvate dehydrogenase E1 component beta subunit
MAMKTMKFTDAADSALAQAMAKDARIIIIGEDTRAIRANLFVRFGQKRVRNTPISESAFLGAAVGAAMAGLIPVVEFYMADFLSVALDALLNHAAKIRSFSVGKWNVPLVVRAPCSGGYGDGGQHEQSLWGWLAHIPGLNVVVPSTPADAGGLMLGAIEHEDPVVFMEPKLLCENLMDFFGGASRKSISLDIPELGAKGPVPEKWKPLPLGQAVIRQEGTDISIASVGVGVHRAVEAASQLVKENIHAEVIDLRTISPLDNEILIQSLSKTRRLLVVDEDYQAFGLSGELAALALEADLSIQYARVCTETTIPFNRKLEDKALPNVERIAAAAKKLV